MFEKILIANRGDQLAIANVAAKPNRILAESHKDIETRRENVWEDINC